MADTRSRLVGVRVLGVALALAATGALPALAQQSNAQNQPTPMARMAQQRLSQLYQQLRINPAEQGAWGQFAQVWMQNAEQLDRSFQQRFAQLGAMNAVQNMQSYAQIEMQQAQDMQRLIPAFQQLYATLSPDQQRTADEMFRESGEQAQSRRNSRG